MDTNIKPLILELEQNKVPIHNYSGIVESLIAEAKRLWDMEEAAQRYREAYRALRDAVVSKHNTAAYIAAVEERVARDALFDLVDVKEPK